MFDATKLKALREQRGWTQSELARRADCTQGAITHIETAKKHPSIAMAFRLAKALGVALDDLMSQEAEPVAVAEGQE